MQGGVLVFKDNQFLLKSNFKGVFKGEFVWKRKTWIFQVNIFWCGVLKGISIVACGYFRQCKKLFSCTFMVSTVNSAFCSFSCMEDLKHPSVRQSPNPVVMQWCSQGEIWLVIHVIVTHLILVSVSFGVFPIQVTYSALLSPHD